MTTRYDHALGRKSPKQAIEQPETTVKDILPDSEYFREGMPGHRAKYPSRQIWEFAYDEDEANQNPLRSKEVFLRNMAWVYDQLPKRRKRLRPHTYPMDMEYQYEGFPTGMQPWSVTPTPNTVEVDIHEAFRQSQQSQAELPSAYERLGNTPLPGTYTRLREERDRYRDQLRRVAREHPSWETQDLVRAAHERAEQLEHPNTRLQFGYLGSQV